MWVVRGAIPAGWWLDLIEAARRRRVPGLSLALFAAWARERRLADESPPRAQRRRAAP
jgi:hypothetical protein